jgi:hypothetical protein
MTKWQRNNNKGIEKGWDVWNTKVNSLDMKIFIWPIGGTEALRVEGIVYNVKGHQKHIGNVASTKIKILLHLIYICIPRVIGNYGRKHIGEH